MGNAAGKPQTNYMWNILWGFPLSTSLSFVIKKEGCPAFSLPSPHLVQHAGQTLLWITPCPTLLSQPHGTLHQEVLTGRLCRASPSLTPHNVGWQPTNKPAICTKEKIRLQKVVLGRTCYFKLQKWTTCHCHKEGIRDWNLGDLSSYNAHVWHLPAFRDVYVGTYKHVSVSKWYVTLWDTIFLKNHFWTALQYSSYGILLE